MKKRTSLPRRAPKRPNAGAYSQKRKNASEQELTGVFSGTRRAFGFVTPLDGGEDIFIPTHEVRGALHGDTVRVRYKKNYERGFEGKVTEILEKSKATVIGTLFTERIRGSRAKKYAFFLAPDSQKYPEAFPLDQEPDCNVGDKIECRIERGRFPYAVFLRSFGPASSLEANCASILAENAIETEFSGDVLREAAACAAIPLSYEGRRKVDEPVLTIDGADAKDLDDAVSLKETDEGFLLSVHIADVSEYVKPKTALDRTAMHRGTSVYYANHVIPMLPEALSNGACSLHPGEDKYTLTARITLSKEGKILQTLLEKTVIKTDVRGVYSEVNDLFEKEKDSAFYEKYQKVYPMLLSMRRLYEILRKNAEKRGYLDFDAPEPYFIMDEGGLPKEVVCRERGDAERLIEHFMLTANEAVATLLYNAEIPSVFRIHEAPPPDRLEELRHYLANLGLSTLPLFKKEPTSLDFAEVLAEAKEKGKEAAVSYPMLRTMAKAVYSDECRPHFGLGIAHYCHFTSPIRRLSDLVTHRIIKAVLLHGDAPQKYAASARRAAAAATDTELRAMTAERSLTALYTALWAEGHIGEEFSATVSGVTAFGMFATLENSAEGLIPMDALPFGAKYDEETSTLQIGRELYRLADRVRVVITDAEPFAGRIRLSLLEKEKENISDA